MSGRRVGGLVLAVALLGGLCLVLGTALGRPAGSASSASPLLGKSAPALSGSELGGGTFRLRHRPGTLTIVNIWASWCGPCRDELPLIAAAARHWPTNRVRLVTVNTKDGPAAARELLHEVHAPHLLTVEDPNGSAAVAWGATGIPETFVVDGAGRIRAHSRGPVTRAWLQEQVDRWARR